LKALFQEIKDVTQMIRENGQRVDCVYIGGGTPTALSEDQIERLLAHVDAHLDVESLVEYTVEAGRPDSITEAKLKCMKHYGVDRICINPQTMNDETFKVIGRNHDSSAVKAVHAMAKSIGFKTINMDLIVGLPGEDLGSIQATMEEMRRFNPENITLHTLAVKRSSKLNEAKNAIRLTESDQITEMMDDAMAALYNMDMHPYYMYRQKRILANLENVGFSKPGHESIYNMRIMEERHPIVALGAGASSKLIDMQTQKFERQANIKGVEAYIERVDEMIEKKRNYFEHI
jgi:oxygen-independent coproporphyrinogen-3 oxidase